MRLSLFTERLAVCRLEPGDPIPGWALHGAFCSVTRAPGELSIVCAERSVPAGVRAESGWRLLAIAGPLPFSLTGVLASIAVPLADARVSIFAISTFDTDYVLVKDADLARALDALRASGHHVLAD
jgi:uncharacterized protein